MKRILIITIILISSILFGEEISLTKAKSLIDEKKFDQAEKIFEQLLEKEPKNAKLLAEYGLLFTKKAGTVGMFSAAMLTRKSYKIYAKAIKADENYSLTYLYRGILSVNVPKFLGKLDNGIEDLKISIKDKNLYNTSIFYLAFAYEMKEQNQKAIELYNDITLYQKDSEYYESAKKRLTNLQKKEVPGKANKDKSHFSIAKKYLEKKELEKARTEFEMAIKEEPKNLQLHLLYAKTLGDLAQNGYDKNISKDVQYLAQIAQDVKDIMDKCVELAPNSIEIRTMRGTTFINLPFFVKSLKTGIKDLNWIIENSKDKNQIQQMKRLLKFAKQKRNERDLTDSYLKTKNKDLKKEIIQKFLKSERTIEHDKSTEKYIEIAVEFGFKDYIAPQISLWLEDETGNYLETLYVSKFSAEVKEKQIHLIEFAKSSKFEGLEAVSGASIDAGKHIFKWNLKNIDLEKKYNLNIEICHWPHVKYKHVEIPLNLTKDNPETKEKYGDLIYSVQTKLVN